MVRLFAIIAASALSAIMFASDLVVRAVSFALELVPSFVSSDAFRINADHPRSIFETRRAGLA